MYCCLNLNCVLQCKWPSCPFAFILNEIKNCPFPWGCGPPSNTWFLWPTRAHNPNGILIGSAVFAGLITVTDRQTDHATRSVTIGRIYVRSAAMRLNNVVHRSGRTSVTSYKLLNRPTAGWYQSLCSVESYSTFVDHAQKDRHVPLILCHHSTKTCTSMKYKC